MMRGRAAPDDAIQFLEPRAEAFGGDAPVDFAGLDLDDMPDPDDGEPASRWLAGAAGLVVLAMIAIGVVAAAPWDGGRPGH